MKQNTTQQPKISLCLDGASAVIDRVYEGQVSVTLFEPESQPCRLLQKNLRDMSAALEITGPREVSKWGVVKFAYFSRPGTIPQLLEALSMREIAVRVISVEHNGSEADMIEALAMLRPWSTDSTEYLPFQHSELQDASRKKTWWGAVWHKLFYVSIP